MIDAPIVHVIALRQAKDKLQQAMLFEQEPESKFSSFKPSVFGQFPLPLPSFHKQREVVFSLGGLKFPVSPRYF